MNSKLCLFACLFCGGLIDFSIASDDDGAFFQKETQKSNAAKARAAEIRREKDKQPVRMQRSISTSSLSTKKFETPSSTGSSKVSGKTRSYSRVAMTSDDGDQRSMSALKKELGSRQDSCREQNVSPKQKTETERLNHLSTKKEASTPQPKRTSNRLAINNKIAATAQEAQRNSNEDNRDNKDKTDSPKKTINSLRRSNSERRRAPVINLPSSASEKSGWRKHQNRMAETSDDESVKQEKKEKNWIALLKDEKIRNTCENMALLMQGLKNVDQSKISSKSFFHGDSCVSPFFPQQAAICTTELVKIANWSTLFDSSKPHPYLCFIKVMNLIPAYQGRFGFPKLDFSDFSVESLYKAINEVLLYLAKNTEYYMENITLDNMQPVWNDVNDKLNFLKLFNSAKTKDQINEVISRCEHILRKYIYICANQIKSRIRRRDQAEIENFVLEKLQEDLCKKANVNYLAAAKYFHARVVESNLLESLGLATRRDDNSDYEEESGEDHNNNNNNYDDNDNDVDEINGDTKNNLANSFASTEDFKSFCDKIEKLLQAYYDMLYDLSTEEGRVDWFCEKEGYIWLYYLKSFIYSLTVTIPYYKQYLKEKFGKTETEEL